MIFGHDFKYEIPAMDRLLGAAADTGIFFPDGSESVGYPGGSAFLVQTVTGRTGGAKITIMASTEDIAARGENG
jgi:hypothetical protein